MKRIIVLIAAIFLAGCGAGPLVAATNAPRVLALQHVTPSVTPTASPNAVATAMMVIEFDRATSTAAAAFTSTSAATTATVEAKQTSAFWVGVTLQVATQRATETQIASTQQAGTQQADFATSVPLTQTPLAATQIVEQDRLTAERMSIWAYRIIGIVFLVGILTAFFVVLYRGIPLAQKHLSDTSEANVMKTKVDALRPDDKGRRPAVPTSVLKLGEGLIIPELAHRSVIQPGNDDLTSQQALNNADNQRKLEAMKSLAESPVMPRMLNRMAEYMVKQMMPEGDGKNYSDVDIQRPEFPMIEQTEGLAQPHFKKLFAWDGRFLPYGVNADDDLMLVDPSRRPHLMVTGDSGSGKTRSGIRTLVSGALVSGWNVVILGKRVDFLPFEEHPNCKVVAVDVRKDAATYIAILRTLTAQMDIRDEVLASKGISTWDRYGAPQTMVVLDDYSGAMWRMSKADRLGVLNEAKQIAMDGRKFGLNLVIGLQRASWTSIDTDLRSQMGRIVYRVSSAVDSRVALDEEGAERLPFLNFLSRLSDDASVQRGVGFMLQDAEVEAFLKSRPVRENEPLDWVDATAQPVEDTDETASTPIIFGDEVEEARRRADVKCAIMDAYLARKSQNKKIVLADIEREVYGEKRGGSFYKNVVNTIAEMEGCSFEDVSGVVADHNKQIAGATEGATTTATQEMPDFSPNPA